MKNPKTKKQSKEAIKILCDFVLKYIEQNRISFEKEKIFDNGILGYDHLDDYIKDLKKYDVETLEWILSEVLYWNTPFKNSGIVINQSGYDDESEDSDRNLITIFNIDGQLIQMKNTQQYLGKKIVKANEQKQCCKLWEDKSYKAQNEQIETTTKDYESPQYSDWQISFDFVEKKQKIITQTIEIYEVI
jgi:hypothetical protein